ncbi:MAG TPA: uroporphyrinogen-III synthase [Acidimicrobiales bacterium]|nr:uroporphyrinogen-III synthase [Acidimicrobiales bacterium]
MASGLLDGFAVGVTADRRAEEQIELLHRHGARALHGPTLRTLPLVADAALRANTEALLRDPPALVLANTALGIRSWLSACESWGLGADVADVLRASEIVARGPKAAGSLVTIGCDVAWRSPSGRLSEVIAHLLDRPLTGVRVASQRDGSDADRAALALRAAGADVVEIGTYRWERPEDEAPAARLLDAVVDQSLDAVTFTSAAAVGNFFALAADRHQTDAVRAACTHGVIPVCVGPVTQEAAVAHGLPAAIAPTRPLLGAMVNTVVDAVARRRVRVDLADHALEVAGTLAIVGGRRVELTAREAAVLRVLAQRAGVVVSKRALLDAVWRDEVVDQHALEVVVSRLRRQLGPAGSSLRTVIRRGYMLAAR